VLGTVVLVFGLLITALDARAVVSPLLAVRDGLHRVERGELDQRLEVYDGTELGALQAGFNRMVAGLRERERIRDIFGRHVGRDVADAALLRSVELGGEVRTVSVLFVDLVGSTTYAAQRPPTEVVELLNRFCGVVVDEVDRHAGLVNKFMGDAVLAVFGAPVDQPGHATAALATARAVAQRLREELPEARCGIGVATGEAVAGNVGDRRRFEYTVIGDAVNAAARLTELAKDRPGAVAAAAETVAAASATEAVHWEVVETVRLRGRAQDTRLAVQASDTRSA
jgi:adenylate cyclase